MYKLPGKELIRDRLREAFDSITVKLERDHRDGLRILAKQALRHRLLMAGMLLANLLAALFEGGTIGILAIAVSVLVDSNTGALGDRFGFLGPYIASFAMEVGRGGLFLVLVLTAVTAQILKSALAYLASYLAIRLRLRVNMELKDAVTRHAMRLSYSEISKYPAGVVNATINQAATFAGLIVTFNRLTQTCLMFVVYVGVMIAMSMALTAAAIIIVGLLAVALIGVVRKLRELGEKMAAATIETEKVTVEYLQAPRLLRIFDATGLAEKAISKARKQMLDSREKAESIRAAIDPATDALTITGAGAFLVVGYILAGESATAIIPRLLLFVFVLNRMMPQVKKFNQARLNFVNAMPTMKRVASFLRAEGKSIVRVGGKKFRTLNTEIRFESVKFRYPDMDQHALYDIDFVIPRGKTAALVGSSGAGKSTIADLLLGLYQPTDGRISVDGKDLQEISMADWRANIGVVDQEVFLLNGTILENIRFAREDCSQEDVIEAAKLAHAHDFIASFEDGYHTEIGDRGFRLSGGQQQRVALARALLRNPQILVLDEATSALDTESERIIQTTLEELHNDRTMLLIAHRLSTLVHADNIVVLEEGRIVEQGTWTELMDHSGAFAKAWRIQMGSARKEGVAQ